MPTLASIQTCTGCGACDNACPQNAIEIKLGSDGFLYPIVNPEKCVECKLCEKVCPIVNGQKDRLKNPESEVCYAMWSYPDRTISSSGGAFSAFARRIIAKGGIVYGAAWDKNYSCRHIAVEEIEDLHLIRGSKYLQSSIQDSFKEIRTHLRVGRIVLFTGTPCQVGGLKSFLMKDYDNLSTIDIVCHGVPSNAIFTSYISKLKREFSEYQEDSGFEFRNRRAWGYAPCSTAPNSSRILVGIANSYMLAFEKSMFFRSSCYNCQFNGLNRTGDVTIADFWGIGKSGKPFRHDISKGVSLVIPNSPRGESLINELENIFIEKRDLSEAVENNHNLIKSSPLHTARENVIQDFLNPEVTLNEIARKYDLVSNSFSSKLKRFLTQLGLFYIIKSIYNKIRIWI